MFESLVRKFWSRERKLNFIESVRKRNLPHRYSYSVSDNILHFECDKIKWEMPLFADQGDHSQ